MNGPAAELFPPAGATDTHVHVIGPRARFALGSPRAYTPPDAPLPALVAMLGRLGLDRVVLVQPSVYGSDNACMLAALADLGVRARAVAVLDRATPGELDRLHGLGVRGLRVNLATLGVRDPDRARAAIGDAVRLCQRHGWHLQIFAAAETIVALERDLARLPVPVVLDHFGQIPTRIPTQIPTASPDGEAETVVLRLLATGRAWVKLSAPYRLPQPGLGEVQGNLAQRLHGANPERTVWGSDWPHAPKHAGVGAARAEEVETPYQDIDTAAHLAVLRDWFDADACRRILGRNPAELYGF